MFRGRERDHGDAGKGERATRKQRARKTFPQEHAGEDRDQDRPDAHEHRGRARVDAALARIQHQVVRAEPEQAAGDERSRDGAKFRAFGQPLPANGADDP
jgi:hypothetical protein